MSRRYETLQTCIGWMPAFLLPDQELKNSLLMYMWTQAWIYVREVNQLKGSVSIT